MKRLVLMAASLAVFGGAAYYGSTGAFFSDTETSTANVFTAGSIDLKVDSTQHYNGNVCTLLTPQASTTLAQSGYYWTGSSSYPAPGSPCSGTWTLKDLNPTLDKFFNFPDVKPGDEGENTVSLHVDTNDAYACADITNIQNDDNTLTEPESEIGDTLATGELAQNLHFLVWSDNGAGANAGNNVWDADEVGLTSGTAPTSNQSYTIADSGTGPLAGGATKYVGVAWCAGTFTTGGPGVTPVCDGSTMGNDVQTDSYQADVDFRVEQARNNPNFTCEAPETTPTEVNVTADNLGFPNWYFYDDQSDVINNALGSFVPGPSVPPHGSNSAQMTASSSDSRTLLTNSSYGGVTLASLTQFAYTELSQSGIGGPNEAPFFRFNVDFNNTNVFQKSLVFVPADNGSITKDVWQNWDMINGGNAKWEYSGAFWPAGVTTLANTIAGTTARNWSAILADYPAIRMWSSGAQLGIRVGEPGPTGYTGNVDSFTIAGTSTAATTYDFGN